MTLSFVILLGIFELQAQQELEIYPGGLVFSRMSDLEIDILTPTSVTGQLIYNIDTARLNYRDDNQWK